MSKFTVSGIAKNALSRQTDFSPFASAKVRIFFELTVINAKSDNYLNYPVLFDISIESPSACPLPIREATGHLVFVYFQATILIAL